MNGALIDEIGRRGAHRIVDPDVCVEHRIGQSRVVCVLLVLAMNADYHYEVWWSTQAIADELGIARAEVREAVAVLLECKAMLPAGKRGRTNCYRFDVSAWTPMTYRAGRYGRPLTGPREPVDNPPEVAGEVAGKAAGKVAGKVAGYPATNRSEVKSSQIMSSPEPAETPPAQAVHDHDHDHDLTDGDVHDQIDQEPTRLRSHREELHVVLADVPRDVRPGLTNAMRTVLDDAHSRGWSPHQLRDELANDRNDYSKCGPGALVARLRALSKTDPSATLSVAGDPWLQNNAVTGGDSIPCGDCDSTRHITLDDGRYARCPNCHPLRRRTTLTVTA